MRLFFGWVLLAVTTAFAADDAAAGRDLYNRSCTMCHGLDGAAGDRAPALGAQRRYLRVTERDLFDAIKHGIKGTMMPSSPLPEADVWKMVAYIRSLRATAIDNVVPGDVRVGEAVFNGKGGCAGCHMIRGRGGLIGPDLSNIAAERKVEDLREALRLSARSLADSERSGDSWRDQEREQFLAAGAGHRPEGASAVAQRD
jgi:mono/diheme cytochrome c family protein